MNKHVLLLAMVLGLQNQSVLRAEEPGDERMSAKIEAEREKNEEARKSNDDDKDNEEIKEGKRIPLDVLLESDTRVRFKGDDKDVGQMFKMRFAYDIKEGQWVILGTVRTGESFNDAYDSVYNIDDKDFSAPNVNMTHLYARGYDVALSGDVLEFGSMPTKQGIAEATALSPEGYIDGVRYKVRTALGDLQVVGGSLVDDADPNMFDRERELNYFEVRFNRHFLDVLAAEELEVQAGIQVQGDDVYFSEAVRATYQLYGGRVLDLIQEGMVQDNGEFKASVGVDFDLINVITGWDTNPIGLRVNLKHTYQSDEMGSLGSSMGDYWYDQKGHSTSLELYKDWQIKENVYLDTGVRQRWGDQDATEFFIRLSISF
jgi:hypothetical protein